MTAPSHEHIYRQLREEIMLGAHPPGEILTMRGTAERLGISPTPVREALRRLNSENAVEALGNRRMAVPRMTSRRFEELIALRIALETHAARRALPHLTALHLERLRQIDALMDAALDSKAHDRLTRLNHDFHRQLYAIPPETAVVPLIESVWLQLGPFQRQVIENVDVYYREDRHKQICEALASRDEKALSSAIAQDIEDGVARAGRAAFAVLGDG